MTITRKPSLWSVEAKTETWQALAAWWSGLAASAEQRGDAEALAEADDEAWRAHRKVEIAAGTSEGPAATWARLRAAEVAR